MVRILDLYSGMGGLSLGFALALPNVEILGLDIDKGAVDTYNLNLNRYGARAETQDVLKWEPRGEFDIVMGGVPCQPYSIANTKRRGTEHSLYPTLPRFFDVILALKPKVFMMENVKGLASRRHRPLLEQQLARVRDHYLVGYRVLNAAFYGVPQRRERLFVLGIRRDLGVAPGFPEPTHAEAERVDLTGRRIHRWVTVREAIGDLLSIPPQGLTFTHKRSLTERVLETTWRPTFTSEEPSFTVTDSGIRVVPSEHDTEKKLMQTNPRHGKPVDLDSPSRTVKVDGRGGDFTFDTMLVPIEDHMMTEGGGWDSPRSDWGSRVMSPDRPAYTITEKHRSGQLVPIPAEHVVTAYIDEAKQFKPEWARRHPVIDANDASPTIVSHIHKNATKSELAVKDVVGYRRLTVRECLRLQSFPDWWSFPEISVSKKYKLTGEAVCPALAYRLATHIGKLFGWKTREPPRFEDWRLPYFYRMFADYYSNEERL